MCTRIALTSTLFLLLLSSFFLSPLTVLAIDDPDDMQVLGTYVYQDCLEAGDRGVLIDYLIDYASLPSESATEAYLAVFLDTDGTTQLASVAPYAFVDNGYGRGLMWIYFTAAQAATYNLIVANSSLYRIRLVGNPTVPSGWTGDPPSVLTSIDLWQTEGSTSVIIALRVLYYAEVLGLAWGYDLLQTTSLGNRLATLGETYFTNVIPGLRAMAPGAFASGTVDPIDIDQDFTTEFGAIMENLTGTVIGSPITLTEGENTVTVTAAGTFLFTLEQGTVGTVSDGTGTVTGSPVDLVEGESTITVPVAGEGTLIADVNLENTQTGLTDTVAGTAFDVSDAGVHFGMSTMWMSSVIWFIITLLVCAATYRVSRQKGGAGASKMTFLIFDVVLTGGILLGMMPLAVGILLFLGCNFFIGYIVFFKPANV